MTGSRPVIPPAHVLGGLFLLLAAPAFAQVSIAPASPTLPGVDLRCESLSGPLNHPRAEGIHVLYGGELSLDADEADGDRLLGRYVLRGNAQAHEADTTIRAEEITFDGPARRAAATQALLTRGVFTLRAPRIDATKDLITAENGDLTTVPNGGPADFYVRAQTITLDQKKQRGTLRNASLYVFHTRLLTLPRLNFHLGSQGHGTRHQVMIPVIGVSSRYGTYVTFGSGLSGAPFPVHYRLMLPTRQSVEGSLDSEQTLVAARSAALPSPLPSGPVTLLSRIRTLATAPRLPLPEGDPLLFRDFLPEANPISLFDLPERGSLTLAEEASVHLSARGNKRDDLYVSRLPEVIVTGQIPVTPVPVPPVYGDSSAFRRSLRHLVLYADAQETLGSYREQLSNAPYSTRARRVRTQIGLSARPLLIGPNTVLLPRVSVSTSSYSGDETAYRYDQLSLAVNHYFSSISAVGIQYLASSTGGSSPFNFDVLDTSRELDVRVQIGSDRLVAAGRVRYDLSRGGVIDYQLALSPAQRGFSPVFSYNFRTRSLGLGIEIKGITF